MGHLSLRLGYLSLSAVIDCIAKFIAFGDFGSVELFVGMNVGDISLGGRLSLGFFLREILALK